MPTDLESHINEIIAVDTHEHLGKELWWMFESPADLLNSLFSSYMLCAAADWGVSQQTWGRISNEAESDVQTRWELLKPVWEDVRHTGYGEACSLVAQEIYGINEITPDSLRTAQPRLDALRRPGERLRLLRDVARLDHVQVDHASWQTLPDASDPEFFLYDLSWWQMSCGELNPSQLAQEFGINPFSLSLLRRAIESIFEKHGPLAIAVKTQHAYSRPLRWIRRTDADAERSLATVLRQGPNGSDEASKMCLGDWCLGVAAELAPRYGLPVKIHTGYKISSGAITTEQLRPSPLEPLLRAYPGTRFVLMHAGYPFGEELIAVVKHFSNAYADLCWAWAVNPFETTRFVRSFIHAVSAHKLFAFGGDTDQPTSVVGYSLQMRRWLARALQAEINDGLLRESDAKLLADRFLRSNALAQFDVKGKRAAIHNALARGYRTV